MKRILTPSDSSTLVAFSLTLAMTSMSALGAAGHGHDEHGKAWLNMTIDSPTTATGELEMSSEDAYGAAKKPEGAALQPATDKVKAIANRLGEIAIFDAKQACEISPQSEELWVTEDGKSDHGMAKITFKVTCKAPFKGTTLKTKVGKVASTVKKLEVNVMEAGKKKTTTLARDRGFVDL